MNETFKSLFMNAAHWEFEIFLMLLFDGAVGMLIWPFIKKHWEHHVERDKQDRPKAKSGLYHHTLHDGRTMIGCLYCNRKWLIPEARCPIATRNTKGTFYCTRDAGHDGPCAAVLTGGNNDR